VVTPPTPPERTPATGSGAQPATSRIRKALEAAATQANATDALQQIVSVVQRTHPDVAREIGW
jgi:hypothetical protein